MRETDCCYRSLQERVDKLEADKESLVNHIFDLRQLLQLINADGESQINLVKAKNAELQTKAAQLYQALQISRENSTYFQNMYSYWSTVVDAKQQKKGSKSAAAAVCELPDFFDTLSLEEETEETAAAV
jgi:hypothetical protein